MTTLRFPQATTPGPRTCTDRVLLRTQAAPTNAFVTTDEVQCMGIDYISFGFLYTKGDETRIEFKPEGWNGVDWVPLGYKGAPTSGASELTPDVLNLTAANYAAGANLGDVGSPPYYCAPYQKVRGKVRYVGGTGTSTIGVTATGVVSIARG